MKLIRKFYLITVMSFAVSYAQGQKPSNIVPMYGEVEKTEEYRKLDDDFINETIASKGSREKGSEHFMKRGWAYFYHDSLDLSMKRFNQAWLLNPDNPDVYFGFAALTETKGNSNDAMRYYKLGLAKDINHDRAIICYKKIADCKEHIQDYKGTIKAYEDILSVEPQNSFAYKKLGYFNSQLGQNDVAMNNYNRAIVLDPTDANTYINRGYLHKTLKNGTMAIADYTIAIKLV